LNVTDGVPKEGLRIQDVLVRLAILHLIRDKVKALIEDPSMPLFSKGAHTYRYYSLRNTKVWKEEHDRKLLYAICMYVNQNSSTLLGLWMTTTCCSEQKKTHISQTQISVDGCV
jgi:hypothetical protein